MDAKHHSNTLAPWWWAAALATLLALVVLTASAGLRLGTVWSVSDGARSVLAPSVQGGVRLLHRLAAGGLGALALGFAWLALRRRYALSSASRLLAGTVVLTVLVLAVIGPLTPGYRHAWVTVANVVLGTVLAGACWGLAARLRGAGMGLPPPTSQRADALVALCLLTQVLLGATASDGAMRLGALPDTAFVHAFFALVVVLILGWWLWQQRAIDGLGLRVRVAGVLLGIQCALGLAAALNASVVMALGLAHAVGSALLVACCADLCVRRWAR